jgi:hypothetical protein
MQRYTVFFIVVIALHVSSDFSAHHQEIVAESDSSTLAVVSNKFDKYPMLKIQFLSYWWWAETPPETCRALTTIKNIVERSILLIVLKNAKQQQLRSGKSLETPALSSTDFFPWLQYSGTLQTVQSVSYLSWISVSLGQTPLMCKPVMMVQPWHLVKKVCYSVNCQAAFYAVPFHRYGVTSLFNYTLNCFKFSLVSALRFDWFQQLTVAYARATDSIAKFLTNQS